MSFSAKDEKGQSVDWWFMYKAAGRSTTGDGRKLTGTEYVYFDANTPSKGKLVLSPHHVDTDGALPNTLQQVYAKEGAATRHQGWFFYNDENPINGKTNGSRGHTKGVLAFDLASDTAFWLIQSTPKFPPKGSYSFPKSGRPNAQTLLCITLENADTALSIAKQMFVAHQPNVYLSSKIPVDLANEPNDPRVKLMQNQVASGSTPVQVVVPFNSKGGVKFISMAKNKTWGHDFYNDLVGPTLHDDLNVETWEHDPTPLSLDSDKVHTVVDMDGINLNPLGIDIRWSESNDHAKLAISARSEDTHYVCVGDINFTIAQRKRGGGTVAFLCEALWRSISLSLVDVSVHVKPGSVAAKQQKALKAAKLKANPPKP
jgi:deoxyribonuclease-2